MLTCRETRNPFRQGTYGNDWIKLQMIEDVHKFCPDDEIIDRFMVDMEV